jgi:hypothetical protein
MHEVASNDGTPTTGVAAAWFYIPAMFDALSVPTRWVWRNDDFAMNALLDEAVGAESGAASGKLEWRAGKARKPSGGRDDSDWEPHYFPDEPWDEKIARAKHDIVMDASIIRKQAIEDLLIAEGRRVDAAGILDALSGGEFLFSQLQYASVGAWVNQGVTDFAVTPPVRWQIYRMWTDAPLLAEPEDAERAQQMLRGGPVFAVSPKTADHLGRIMRGEE